MSACRKAYVLRKGRCSEVGQVYSITCVTVGRAQVFSCLQSARSLVAQLRALHDAGDVESLAWVVMPDHLHWLFQLRRGDLATIVGRMKARSSLAINRRNGTCGRLWQKGYYGRALRREDDLRSAARYIIMNPVRAGLVKKVGDYPLWDAIWL
ncbi:transposase [Pseudomonas sp. CFBP 8770]|uniref:REP-associated tyrosine transposase n=1 Tax=unclassified Pseudomonas TaxID=196821 RepID=UPI001783A086|nr:MULTISPECIES: transposase [unclassified Pseudomonas]MBD8472571.1 transposase [Pseudomonas sp. CFBP 8773]MBD8649360.1 transposase [Pseudomonas sp. CFBP 8770]